MEPHRYGAESLEAQVTPLKVLYMKWLKVSWAKTKVHSLTSLQDDTIQSVHTFDKDIGGIESFTYLDRVVQSNEESRQEVTRRIIVLDKCYYNSLSTNIFSVVDVFEVESF